METVIDDVKFRVFTNFYLIKYISQNRFVITIVYFLLNIFRLFFHSSIDYIHCTCSCIGKVLFIFFSFFSFQYVSSHFFISTVHVFRSRHLFFNYKKCPATIEITVAVVMSKILWNIRFLFL
jgi:hypothetical protein